MKTRILTFSLSLLLATGATAQQLADGHHGTVTALPNGTANVLQLADGALVFFTGTDLVVQRGPTTQSLLHFAGLTFGSFTIEAGPGRLLFGENSTGDIWLVPLNGPTAPRVVARLPLNYDAAMVGRDLVVVSAKTGGFAAPDNDLVAIDLHAGTTRPIGMLPGASGPLAGDAHGGLLYATSPAAFPPPPASVAVLTWTAPQVLAAWNGAQPLTTANATVLAHGLDAAGDLALDGDDDLFFTDWWNNAIGELSDVHRPGLRRSTLLGHGSAIVSGTGLQFRGPQASPGAPQFEPFQPDGGGVLLVHESAWNGPSQLRAVRAARAATHHSGPTPIPAGPFDLITEQAAPHGFAVVAIGLFATPLETVLPVAGFEQPLFWNAGLLAHANTHLVPIDARGRAVLSLRNPGVPGGLDVFTQTAFVSAAAAVPPVVGSGPPVALRLGR